MTADAYPRTMGVTSFSQLMGGADDKTIAVPCRRCKAPVDVYEWLVDMVKAWNREEFKLVETESEAGRRYQARPIRKDEIVACHPCTVVIRNEMERADAEEAVQAALYVAQVRGGTGDADPYVVEWLVNNGYGRQLEQARASARATVARPPAAKPKKGAHVPPPDPAPADAPTGDMFDHDERYGK